MHVSACFSHFCLIISWFHSSLCDKISDLLCVKKISGFLVVEVGPESIKNVSLLPTVGIDICGGRPKVSKEVGSRESKE